MFILLVAWATAYQVPETIENTERLAFYEKLKDYQLEVRNYQGMGLGLQANRQFKQGEGVFCLSMDTTIRNTDYFPLVPYAKSFNTGELLISRVLYEKFMAPRGSFLNQYIHTLPTEIKSPKLWSKVHVELFEKFNTLLGYGNFFNTTEEFEKITKAFKKIYGAPREVFDFKAYSWASYIVLSHSMTYKNETNGEVVACLSPFIDLANHWPRPYGYEGDSFSFTDDSNCLVTFKDLEPGDQIFADYGRSESSFYFYKYQFNLENNPYDSMIYTYNGNTPTYKNQFYLQTNQINLEVLEIFTADVGLHQVFTPDFRTYYSALFESDKIIVVLRAFLVYWRQFMKGMELEGFPGLRENRRYRPKDSDEEIIVKFTAAVRKTMYSHRSVLEKEMIFAFHKLLF